MDHSLSEFEKASLFVFYFMYIFLYSMYFLHDGSKSCFILCQTDTASVLSEAIEYIKFLHEQVSVSPINLDLCYIVIIYLLINKINNNASHSDGRKQIYANVWMFIL